jgi:hypothetical protein
MEYIKAINAWLLFWEPIWLFTLIAYEGWILTAEYFYDARIDDAKKKRKKITKNRVKISIDSDGNATVLESPKNLDVSIDHLGKEKQ